VTGRPRPTASPASRFRHAVDGRRRNGDLAWAFTNAYGDFVDLVVVGTDPADPERTTPAGWRRLSCDRDDPGQGADPESLDVASTIWGRSSDHDHRGRPRALRWTAHDVRR
jgi:penicillin amidase